jgi:hypothetical protein
MLYTTEKSAAPARIEPQCLVCTGCSLLILPIEQPKTLKHMNKVGQSEHAVEEAISYAKI